MDLLALVTELRQLDIILSLTRDEKLGFDAPVGVFTETLIVCIKHHKEALKDMIIARAFIEEPGL
jgi:hypothetical protein